jgi:endonuclease/exonuclease/phosphatase family metal-dependent hydrolase
LLSKGERYIDVTVTKHPDAAPWRVTFVYGEPRVEKRKDMWDLMRRLCGEWLGPWVLMGDFNEAMWQYQHFSKTPRPEKQMMDFREVLSHCDLHDLGFSGLPWTYNQGGSRKVRVRLDRRVANSDWMSMWPSTNVVHLTSPQSDHKARLVEVRAGNEIKNSSRIFRYEIMWEREENLGSVVQQAW